MLGVWGPEVLQQIVDLGGDGFSNWINHMDAASRQFRQNAISQGIGEFIDNPSWGRFRLAKEFAYWVMYEHYFGEYLCVK
jgi:hypothetical protein